MVTKNLGDLNMTYKKTGTLTLITTSLFFLATGLHAETIVTKIVAKVDNEVITQSDVVQGHGLDNVINEKILDAELKKENMDVSSDEIDEAVQGLAFRQKITMDELKSNLVNKGISVEQFREGVRGDIEKNRYLQKINFPRRRIDDAELQAYYQKHADEFKSFGQLRYQEILLTPESVPTGQTLKDFAGQIVVQLKKGANFTTLARQYSRGPFASNGGDSGVLNVSGMRADLAKLLLTLPINAINEPLGTPNGYFIFRMLEKKNPQAMPFTDAKEAIRQKMFEIKSKEELEKYLVEIRSKHYVEIVK